MRAFLPSLIALACVRPATAAPTDTPAPCGAAACQGWRQVVMALRCVIATPIF
jgi:hypothetical protein